MPGFDRIDINKRWPIPNWIKLLLLIAVIFGFSLRSCWKKQQAEAVSISDIEIGDFTIATIDVNFVITNPHQVSLKKPILIRVILTSGEELASRLTSIEIPPQSRKRYLKMLDKFSQPLASLSQIEQVTVEVYNP